MGNIARNNLTQLVGIGYAVISYNDNPVLFIIPEQPNKPLHLRGPNIFDSYIRSVGQTVKLSCHKATQLIALSSGNEFELQTSISNVDKDKVIEQIDCDS